MFVSFCLKIIFLESEGDTEQLKQHEEQHLYQERHDSAYHLFVNLQTYHFHQDLQQEHQSKAEKHQV